jgi:hypothetical protein
MSDLEEQIHTLMERGIRPVAAAEAAQGRAATGRGPGGRVIRRRPAPRIALLAAGVGVCACAAVLAAAQLGSPARPSRPASAARPPHQVPAVLTAAMVRQLVSASDLALAHSGEAVIRSRQSLQGVLQQSDTDDITFDGSNWNDSFSQTFAATPGQAPGTQSAVNRVVNGQAYDYFTAADGLAWYHDTGPNAVSSMHIPDPRRMLDELAPAAGFVKAGTTTINGVPVQELRATSPAALQGIQVPEQWNDGALRALNVWVDSRGVVRQLSLSFRLDLYPGTMSVSQLRHLPKGTRVIGWKSIAPGATRVTAKVRKSRSGTLTFEVSPAGNVPAQLQITSVVVDFRGIGQHQVIRIPAHAIPTYGLG